eukprot:756437-Hanusia_phi.AAC.2
MLRTLPLVSHARTSHEKCAGGCGIIHVPCPLATFSALVPHIFPPPPRLPSLRPCVTRPRVFSLSPSATPGPTLLLILPPAVPPLLLTFPSSLLPPASSPSSSTHRGSVWFPPSHLKIPPKFCFFKSSILTLAFAVEAGTFQMNTNFWVSRLGFRSRSQWVVSDTRSLGLGGPARSCCSCCSCCSVLLLLLLLLLLLSAPPAAIHLHGPPATESGPGSALPGAVRGGALPL